MSYNLKPPYGSYVHERVKYYRVERVCFICACTDACTYLTQLELHYDQTQIIANAACKVGR